VLRSKGANADIGLYADRRMTFWTNSQASAINALTIMETGNVGIGTTNPTAKFSVIGGIRVGSTYAGIGSTAATNNSWFEGNVGIGVGCCRWN
jgi:hypothetical protein